jgi:hypothetical protein
MYGAALIIAVGWSWLGQISQESETQNAIAESVDVRYARAQLRLAEVDLQRVVESNKRVARSVPEGVVAEFRDDVLVAKARLELAVAGRRASDFQVWLKRAAAEARAAESSWQRATAANDSAPGTFRAIDLERYQLRAEVAKLQLERGQALADAGREAQLEWEVDLLNNQVQRLEAESGRATSFIGLYPVWAW